MAEQRPRVRVTAPKRHQGTALPRSRVGDVTEQTELGGIYLRSLLREQLLVAGRVLAVVVVAMGGLPLAFALLPGLSTVDFLGIPVAWIALGVLVYPALWLLGWRYVRRVERNEADFVDLVRGRR